ncbi:hypothetical protein [Vibrio europaeus]|uniref:hypothetical protein n=1 Tax=Vibrio europaeus TaxID=300876 RepID=UPI00233F0AD0|nr:hypothetical protein [Vibrio europaeus]MDC5753580.1 hypothetical protein [Vibrio europaeus]MDC5816507.1 hypothetical protein [Vibrio europaeus]
MQQEPANMKDFQALAQAGLLGELVAFESPEHTNVFNIVGVSQRLEKAFVLYDTELAEARTWNGTRNLFPVAQKIGYHELKIRASKKARPTELTELKLSSGHVINFQ